MRQDLIPDIKIKYPELADYLKFSANDIADRIGYDLNDDELQLKSAIDANIEKYQKDVENALEKEPAALEREKSEYFRANLEFEYIKKYDRKTLTDILQKIKGYNPHFNNTFYEKKIEEILSKSSKNNKAGINKKMKSLYKNVLNEWKEILEKKTLEWQKDVIEKIKREVIDRLKAWLEIIKKFKYALDTMGDGGEIFYRYVMQSLRYGMASGMEADEYETGLMAGGGNGIGGMENLHRKSMNFQRWLNLLQQDSIKKLCDLLGKLSKEEKKIEFEQYSSQIIYRTSIPTPYANEEIKGVTFGRDLENMLPSELALMDDDDFGILFDLKWAENRLFCFEKQGYEDKINIEEITETREKETEDKKGPIILCIDTSGSMSGPPERIAKAVTLFMAKRALEQKRNCYLINFSTRIECLDLTPPNGLFELMNFLELSFNGGTDSLPALKEGIRKMNENNYKKADLLLVSDFIFDKNDETAIRELLKNTSEDNKFYALYVGNFANSTLNEKIFDEEFIYNPKKHDIETLCRLNMRMRNYL